MSPDDTAADYPSVEELLDWFAQEARDMAKAFELRTKDGNELVTDYSAGKYSPKEASEKLARYERRWGEALFGAHAAEGITDQELLAIIDEARGRQISHGTKRGSSSFQR
jgi:hypothetical protein